MVQIPPKMPYGMSRVGMDTFTQPGSLSDLQFRALLQMMAPGAAKPQAEPAITLTQTQLCEMIRTTSTRDEAPAPATQEMEDDFEFYDIGYLNPTVDDGFGESKLHFHDKHGNLVWSSVIMFIDSIRTHNTSAQRDAKIRSNFARLLRGTAFDWWTSICTEEDRREWLQSTDKLTAALRKYLGPSEHRVQTLLRDLKYTSKHLLKHEDFRSWAAKRLTLLRYIGGMSEHEMLCNMHAALDYSDGSSREHAGWGAVRPAWEAPKPPAPGTSIVEWVNNTLEDIDAWYAYDDAGSTWGW